MVKETGIKEVNGAIFIVGLSGAGKTTLAKLLIKRLREYGRPCLLMDGCEMNSFRILGDESGHDLESRKRRGLQLLRIVKWVASQGILPVVAVIGQPPEARRAWREQIHNYREIYLKCDLQQCIQRDNKRLYASALRNEEKCVVGIDLPFVEPTDSEMILDSGILLPEELLNRLWYSLLSLKWFQQFLEAEEYLNKVEHF